MADGHSGKRLSAGRALRATLALLALVGASLLTLPSLAAAVTNARAVAPLTTGFVQDQWPQAPYWNPTVRALGGSYLRYELSWSAAEPRRPAPGSDPGNPANPAFEWQQYIDQQVRNAAAAGLRVMLVIDRAPSWAEAPGRPASVPQGTWRPDPSAFAAFAHAVAVRYSGAYPDPLHHGAKLPAVRDYIAWNEPNEPSELNPQWATVGGHIVPASPEIFRPMLNAFYSAVKSVSSANRVIAGGLAPYGDPPGVKRMQPMTFLRTLLCLNGSLNSACNRVSAFDAFDMHPFSPKDPHWHALNADDVAPPDVYKVNRALSAAVRLHHVAPAGPKSVIVTEFSWDTNPPDPRGLPLQTQARYLEDGLNVLWHQGVHTILWWRLTDQNPGSKGYPYTYQSGVLFENGTPKPSATAFKFPFVVHHVNRKKVVAWGRVPSSGTLRIQRLVGHKWKTLHTYRVGGNNVFNITLKLRGSALLRAVSGSNTSLNWSLR